MANTHDKRDRRCPRLGSVVAFSYCRACGEAAIPCGRIFDCWWETFDVTGFLKETLPEDVFSQLTMASQKPKLMSLVEIIEDAKKRTAGRDD